MAKHDLADNTYRSIKADLDSKTSLYNIAVEHVGQETREARKQQLQSEAKQLDNEVKDLQARLTKAQDELDRIDQEFYKDVMQPLAPPQQQVNQAEDDLKKLTAGFDRFAKVAAQKRWKFGDEFRRLPILDAFESPTKIKQLWLPDLTIDYGGFKDVPRYDRCISCHLGIERGTFDHASLTRLTRSPQAIQKDIDATLAKVDDGERSDVKSEIEGLKKAADGDTKEKIDSIRKEIAEAKDADKKAELERKRSLYAMVLEYKSAAAMEGRLKQAQEILMERKKAGENLGFDPSDLPNDVRWLNLTKGQIKEYAAHPRLDLFVDANSPHPMEKFGCTACHAGQGSATDFVLCRPLARQRRARRGVAQEIRLVAQSFLGLPHAVQPLHRSRAVLKCHHEVTDLIRQGSKQEAPKLLRGYHLIQENGCFGCHEIASVKGGREVGPDLRLEPQPALAYLTPAEQEQGESRSAQPARPVSQGRSQPAPPRREDQPGLGAQVGAVAARLPSGYQDAALLRPEQQQPGRAAGHAETLPRYRDCRHCLLPAGREQGQPGQRRKQEGQRPDGAGKDRPQTSGPAQERAAARPRLEGIAGRQPASGRPGLDVGSAAGE